VAIFFDAAKRGARLRVNARKQAGDPGCVRDYVYVSDVARANVLALSGAVEQPILNVAAGEPTTTLELAQAVLKRLGRELAVDTGAPRDGDLERSVLDPSLAIRYLGQPVSLDQGLDETHAYYASRPG
jgi:UDP-glucose 4-epimerase